MSGETTGDTPFGGQVLRVTEAAVRHGEEGRSYPLKCANCSKSLQVGELYFNRKRRRAFRPSRIYCIECAKRLGLVITKQEGKSLQAP